MPKRETGRQVAHGKADQHHSKRQRLQTRLMPRGRKVLVSECRRQFCTHLTESLTKTDDDSGALLKGLRRMMLSALSTSFRRSLRRLHQPNVVHVRLCTPTIRLDLGAMVENLLELPSLAALLNELKHCVVEASVRLLVLSFEADRELGQTPQLSPGALHRFADSLKGLFPAASVEVHIPYFCSATPVEFVPVLEALAPRIRHLGCTPRLIPLLRGMQLNTLNLVGRMEQEHKSPPYVQALLRLSFDQLVCNGWLTFDELIYGNADPNPRVKFLQLSLNFDAPVSVGHYGSRMRLLADLLPGLEDLNIYKFFDESGAEEDEEFYGRLASHVRELARASQLQTSARLFLQASDKTHLQKLITFLTDQLGDLPQVEQTTADACSLHFQLNRTKVYFRILMLDFESQLIRAPQPDPEPEP